MVERVTEIQPRLLSYKQAAVYLSCTVWFLRDLVWSKQIKFIQLGKRHLFDRRDLDSYIDANKGYAA
jgi:excisionase family DNA binding protein